MTLYRPVGRTELELIAQADFRAFPPRLPIQPIFYPVTNFDYAAQIARDWNTKDPVSGFAGWVTAFDVDEEFLARYERQIVGGRQHEELWVPAEELDEFNAHIKGLIRIEAVFVGESFDGEIDAETKLPKQF